MANQDSWWFSIKSMEGERGNSENVPAPFSWSIYYNLVI
jgi:hypothetical protein